MPEHTLTRDEVLDRAEDWYEMKIRALVDTPENKGKNLLVDVLTGDYEILGSQGSVELVHRPNVALSLRVIGQKYPDRHNSLSFQWSDAWLLLSIVYAGNGVAGGYATLTDIISMGDMLNHAIFNDEEMISGFSRLTIAGLMQEGKGMFAADDSAKSAYYKIAQTQSYPIRQTAPYGEWLIGFPAVAAEQFEKNRAKYAAFIASENEQAYQAYSARHAEMVKKLKIGEGKAS